MIISHKRKFIFIKTAKVAGTSIEVYLSQYCGEDDIVTPIYPHIEPHVSRNYKGIWNPLPEIFENRGLGIWTTLTNFLMRNKFYNHIPARRVKSLISNNIWNEYFKFCVERNPWDKTLSHYHMINERAGGNVTLDEYFYRKNFNFNYPLYTDSNGGLIVDKVIKYESLIDELYQVFNRLGLPFEGTLGVRAKSGHRKDRRPYHEVFSSKQRNIIAKAFAKEIEMHGYTY